MTTDLPQILCLSLPKGFFPSPTKTLHTFLYCSIHATCPAHLSHLNLRFLIMLGEEYNACSSALCNFLYSPVIFASLSSKHLSKYHHHHVCSAEGQVLHCKRRNLGCNSAEGSSSTAKTQGTKAAVSPGIEYVW